MDIDITDLPPVHKHQRLTIWNVPGHGMYQVRYDGLVHRYTVERFTDLGWKHLINLFSPQVVSARGALQFWLNLQPFPMSPTRKESW